ncbi:major pilu subunit operon regulatory protein PapB [Salmonella enterica]|nr:major pilu subunit operon regulatory protein PapB [Salmonella enterica]
MLIYISFTELKIVYFIFSDINNCGTFSPQDNQSVCSLYFAMGAVVSCSLIQNCFYFWGSVMSGQEHYLLLARSRGRSLIPGEMPEIHFWLLVEVSPIHSEKVIQSLKDYLVLGYTRVEACERHHVSPGYFSGALRRLQRVDQTVSQLMPYYMPPEIFKELAMQSI